MFVYCRETISFFLHSFEKLCQQGAYGVSECSVVENDMNHIQNASSQTDLYKQDDFKYCIWLFLRTHYASKCCVSWDLKVPEGHFSSCEIEARTLSNDSRCTSPVYTAIGQLCGQALILHSGVFQGWTLWCL